MKILEDCVGSNIYITLSTQTRQWEAGQAGSLCSQFQGLVQDDDPGTDRIEFAGYEGDTLSFDWGLRCIFGHRPRIVRVLEESLGFERASPKKRTIGSVY